MRALARVFVCVYYVCIRYNEREERERDYTDIHLIFSPRRILTFSWLVGCNDSCN